MKRTRVCRPNVDTLESRVVLSFSFSSIFHSLIGSIGGTGSASTTTTPVLTPAQVAAHKLAVQTQHLQAEARLEHAREIRAEHVAMLHAHLHPVVK
jgi:hypothetical protein